MTHPTRSELLELAARRETDPARSARLNAHIAVCETCSAAFRGMAKVEGALSSIRPESPSPGFERVVMNRLGLREAGSLWWTFLKTFAPVLVAGIVVGSVVSFGSGSPGGAGQLPGGALLEGGKFQGIVSDALGGYGESVGGFIRSTLSSLLSAGSANMTLTIVLLFAGFGLIDRYLVGPMIRRRHQGWRI